MDSLMTERVLSIRHAPGWLPVIPLPIFVRVDVEFVRGTATVLVPLDLPRAHDGTVGTVETGIGRRQGGHGAHLLPLGDRDERLFAGRLGRLLRHGLTRLAELHQIVQFRH